MNIKKGFPIPQKNHWNDDDGDNFKTSVLIAIILIFAVAFVTFNLLIRASSQIDRAVKHADEQTARIWPEDKYGPLESLSSKTSCANTS